MTYHDDETTETVAFGNSMKVIEPSMSPSSKGSLLKKVFVIATTMVASATVATKYSGTGGNTAVDLVPNDSTRVGTKYLNPKCAGTDMLKDFKAGLIWTSRFGGDSRWIFGLQCDGEEAWGYPPCPSDYGGYGAKEFCDTCAGGTVELKSGSSYPSGPIINDYKYPCAAYVIPK
mmetsp:Transcript_19168/g.19464  ORF Transcript_19168/g.19464 Transcript_19168/m.19464 type:complete len:174 (+) Transcript_19168:336-857(+)